MSDSAYSQDISVAPQRYLQRQWKRNKPYLPPSDSLPVLCLCPSRPLFICAQCGFANAWIPLCLWCEWTSTEATRRFEASLPRPRRLSAPSRAVPAPKNRQYPRRKMSTGSAVSSASPHTPRGKLMCHQDRRLDPYNVEAVNYDVIPLSAVPTNIHNVLKEKVDAGGVHRVSTATSITPPLPTSSFPNVAPEPEAEQYMRNSEDRDRKRSSGRYRRGLPALCAYSPASRARTTRSPACTVERKEPDKIITAQATNSATSGLVEVSYTPRSTGSMDMSSDGGHIHSTPSASSSQCSPKRGLRRTKNMTQLQRGSSVSVRSRSPLRESMDGCPTSASEARQLSRTPSHDHDAPPVRLGHPSRPYYSVIRKDMSRPTSPVFSITAPRTPSPIPSHADYVPRGTKSLDCGDRSSIQYPQELRPMSMVLSGRAASPISRPGFSLSGEMELRMNLAQWRREDTPNEPGGYHFRATSRSSSKVNMKRRVQQLGRGLKELVLGR